MYPPQQSQSRRHTSMHHQQRIHTPQNIPYGTDKILCLKDIVPSQDNAADHGVLIELLICADLAGVDVVYTAE